MSCLASSGNQSMAGSCAIQNVNSPLFAFLDVNVKTDAAPNESLPVRSCENIAMVCNDDDLVVIGVVVVLVVADDDDDFSSLSLSW